MFHLLPRKQFDLASPLDPAEALRALSDGTKPPQKRTLSMHLTHPPDGKFQGSITENRFEIWRDIRYRNSFLPLAHGEVVAAGSGSTIHIEMRMHRAGHLVPHLLALRGIVIL